MNTPAFRARPLGGQVGRLATLAVALLVAPGAGCRGEDRTPTDEPRLLAPCHVRGVSSETLCAVVEVPEDPAEPAGRTIPLRVVVVPAVSPDPEPDPLFFLAGGPGQAATEVMGGVEDVFAAINNTRDLVFVDQRGTGSSNPLGCSLGGANGADRLDLALEQTAVDREELARCRDGLDADLTRYTTPFAMDDLDRVREVLGYDRINLYGGSYGTRAALVYLRQHGDRVRTVILDGVAPPSMELFLHFAPDAQAAWERLVADCGADPACATSFPALDATFRALLADLETTPREVTITHPRTGSPETVTLTRAAVAGQVRGLLYSPHLAALLPLALTRAAGGVWEPLVAQSLGMSEPMGEAMSFGMMLSVVCAEDVPRIGAAQREEAARDTFLGDDIVDLVMQACEVWPRGALPEGYAEPVRSDAPVLVLSGALDPVTPPRWGEQVLATLPNGVHAVAPGAGHNVAPLGCTPRRMRDFVEAGTAAGLDLSCIGEIRRPSFFVDFAGPASPVPAEPAGSAPPAAAEEATR